MSAPLGAGGFTQQMGGRVRASKRVPHEFSRRGKRLARAGATLEIRVGPKGYVVPGAYRARCLRVLDGDTAEVVLDLGLRAYQRAMLRIAGVQAPDLKADDPAVSSRAALARDLLAEWLAPGPADLVRWPLRVDIMTKPDPYGRWIADVWALRGPEAPAAERHVNAEMLASGFVDPYPSP
jgi:endonuclease YncB( thermonuclease family)